MSWIDQIFSNRKTSGINPADDDAAQLLGSSTPAAGIDVDEHSALAYSAVWACVGLISETLASLSWHAFRRDGSRQIRMPGAIDDLLNVAPNPEIDSVVFRETEMAKVLTWGNGISEIERLRGGEPAAMWPIEPNRVKVDRDRFGRVVYDVWNRGNSNSTLKSNEVFHVHGLGFDGLTGYSPIHMARESIAAGLAMDRFGAAFFSNGAHLNAVLERGKDTKALNQKAKDQILKDLNSRNQGAANAHRIDVLPRGMTYKGIGVPPEAAQFLESRKFQISDIAGRWYRVPPHMVGELDRATFSNIEHQAIEFVRFTLRRWARKLEIEADRKLLADVSGAYSKIDLNGLLRGDTRTRGEFYRLLMDRGVFSINDVLELEDRNPVPNGDRRFVQRNMVPLDAAADESGTSGGSAPAAKQSEKVHAPVDRELIAASGMDVVSHGVGQALAKECNAARRSSRKYAGDVKAFEDWAGRFYGEHAACVKESILPSCRTIGRLAGLDLVQCEAMAHAYSESHASESLESVVDAFRDGVLEDLLDTWQRERAATAAVAITDQLTQEPEGAGAAA